MKVLLFMLVWLFVSGCMKQAATTTSSSSVGGAARKRPMLVGGDISALADIERRGGVYRDHGEPRDAIDIFTNHGWNCFRLRIFVKPNGRGGVVNSLDYTRALAKRIKASGAQFMLDFHYSDTWADPQHQIKPAAWKDMSFDDLERQVERYTADVIKDLKDNGVCPDIVQVGNEITGGTLWPDAQVQVPRSDVKVYEGDVTVIKVPQPYDDAKQWDHLTRVIKAGVRGVRSVTTADDHVRIMIHIDCGGDWPITQWFFDHLAAANVDYDMVGQSYYPRWHGTLDNVRETLRQTALRYHKDIVVVETAYPWSDAQYWSERQNMAWPISAEGQAQFLADVLECVQQTPDGHGAGLMYWFPEAIPVPVNGRPRTGGALATFDAEGNALPSVSFLERVKS